MFDHDELRTWFSQRPVWLQQAAKQVVSGVAIDEALLTNVCLDEVAGEEVQPCSDQIPFAKVVPTHQTCSLDSIGDVKGVNAITSDRPLVFASDGLTVVYGKNGAGKSGYTRLIRSAAGLSKPDAILPNVFDDSSTAKSATLQISVSTGAKSVQWSGQEITDLTNLAVFDTKESVHLSTQEQSVLYEPPLLAAFSELIAISETVGAAISERMTGLQSKLPLVPREHEGTQSAAFFLALNKKTATSEVEKATSWDETDQKQLDQMATQLAQPDPVQVAIEQKKLRKQALKLVRRLREVDRKYSETNLRDLAALAEKAAGARTTADQAAAALFEQAPLSGVGGPTWRAMWEAARLYSMKAAYPGDDFPKVDDGSRCALCQQWIDSETATRLSDFESFVSGKIEEDAKKLAYLLEQSSRSFEEMLPKAESVFDAMFGIGVEEGASKAFASQWVANLAVRFKEACKGQSDTGQLDIRPARQVALGIAVSARRRRLAALQASDKVARERLEAQYRELSARRWLSCQKDAVIAELARLRDVDLLARAKSNASTTALTRKKSELSEEVITQAFIKRFNSELGLLGAKRIRAELVKTRASKGQILHKVQLSGVQTGRADGLAAVLSEGEQRVIALAAFLALHTAQGSRQSMVFDDPISSLDDDFETHVANRLKEIAEDRQVIVFTHRLSLLYKFVGKSGKEAALVSLAGAPPGQVTELSIVKMKPKAALNTLKGELARLRKAEQLVPGSTDLARSGLCTNLRIVVERIVESQLLGDIVTRWSPEVQTQNKIHHLVHVGQADCDYVDSMMTKYSKYLHSQPLEVPIEPLPMDELGKDIDALLAFVGEMEKRTKH